MGTQTEAQTTDAKEGPAAERWFFWDPVDYTVHLHPTKEAALAEARRTLEYHAPDPGDFWPEDVDRLRVGRITHVCEAINQVQNEADDSLDIACDYVMRPVSPPSPGDGVDIIPAFKDGAPTVLAEVARGRARQVEAWSAERLPGGDRAREDAAAWAVVLRDAVTQACQAEPAQLADALIRVAVTAVAWAEQVREAAEAGRAEG